MKVIVIDDEPWARQIIISIIAEAFPDFQILGEAGSVADGALLIKQAAPDMLFLDVDLTDGSGFDLLNMVRPIGFKVIFITAHQEYALKAIKFSAFDFILKPISTLELTDTINRVLSEQKTLNQGVKWQALFDNMIELKGESKKIVLKTAESIHLVLVSDIIRCEADNNYSSFFLRTGERIVVSRGLKEYEELLTEYGFFRVHQSHLINLKYIQRFDKRDGGFIVLSDKTHVPVSQRKRQKLLDFFEGLK